MHFLTPKGDYRRLIVYRKAECIYDLSFHFTSRYLGIALAAALLLASCHSSRKATETGSAALPHTEQRAADTHTKEPVSDVPSANALVSEALAWVGTPYSYGGASRKGTDCSGMVMAVYQSVAGLRLPRNSAQQQQYCRPVPVEQAAEGDLVFFTTSKNRGRVNHVGLYIGNGSFVHASTSRGVIVSRLSEDYYRRHFHSAGRVPSMPEPTVPAEEAPATEAPIIEEPTPTAVETAQQDSIREMVRRAMTFE